MMINKTILFILPVSSQPRFAKRIQSYLAKRYKVTAASFERDYFAKNTLPDEIIYYPLGKIKAGNYPKRIPKLLSSIRPLLKLSKDADLVYVLSADVLLFLFAFVKKEKLLFEIGDIRSIGTSSMVKFMYDLIYQRALRKCSRIFVTSKGFKDFMSSKYQLDPSKISIIENKLVSLDFPSENRTPFESLKDNEFIVGIIGLLRYPNILDFLQEYQKANVKFRIKIFGDGPLKEQILQYVDGNKIQFFGQFKYPDDLSRIYEQIDLSFTMYDSNDLNVQLALPNKLYESIYFRRPILVSTNTYLNKKVEEFNVGFSWSQDDMQ